MWMDLETVIEWSKSEREKHILYINTYMWNLGKNGTDGPICKLEIEIQTLKQQQQQLMNTKGGWVKQLYLNNLKKWYINFKKCNKSMVIEATKFWDSN